MTEFKKNTLEDKTIEIYSQEKYCLDSMEQGYKEMAAINLSLSNQYFEIEREVECYYGK
jgi:hypothetical protein